MSVVATLSALVWGCLHGLADPLFFGKFFGTVWNFFVYSCAYLAWRKVSFAHAYVATATPHALHNLIIFLIVAALAPPGPREQPAVSAAQKVVLYEEDPADPYKRFVGLAIWRTEMVTPAPGQPPELAIRADIEVPERNLAMTWLLRRKHR